MDRMAHTAHEHASCILCSPHTNGDRSTAWPFVNCLSLGAVPIAASVARIQVRALLIEWGLTRISESAELCVTELMSNALKAVNDLPPDLRRPLGLRVSSDGARVLLETWDCCPELPASTESDGGELPSLDLEGGRGLFLVGTLSQEWGFYPTGRGEGKVVWALLTGE